MKEITDQPQIKMPYTYNQPTYSVQIWFSLDKF